MYPCLMDPRILMRPRGVHGSRCSPNPAKKEFWFILGLLGTATLCPSGRGLLLQPEWHQDPRWVLCTLL